jgi:threonine dehydrogenase-like Zn-dependent dehydrogenase
MPEPRVAPGEVLVRVREVGICGSDLHGYLGKSKIRIPPLVMGHEFTGVVAETDPQRGPRVAGLERDQRVVVQPLVTCGECRYCRAGRTEICPRRKVLGAHLPGAFADYVVAPAGNVYPLPEALSFREGALVEPLANAVHMITLGRDALFADVVVIGAGTLGLLTLQAALLSGAQRVVVADTDAGRLAVARDLGAHTTVNPRDADLVAAVHEHTDGGAALVVDAVGHSVTRQQSVACCANGGTAILLGLADVETTLNCLDITNRQLRVQGSYGSNDADFRAAIRLLAAGRVASAPWVTAMPLRDGAQAFDRLVNAPAGLVKVIFSV